jgi:hypothetical protein
VIASLEHYSQVLAQSGGATAPAGAVAATSPFGRPPAPNAPIVAVQSLPPVR